MTLLAASTARTIAPDSFLFISPAAAKAPVPIWIVLLCHTAIGLGTYFGGWRIVKTMGMKITRLQPAGGFAAETAAGIAIVMASSFGIPVSTTHTITGGIIGSGATRRLSAVRWGVAGRIVWAWILTIPLSAMVAWGLYWVLCPLQQYK
jgi:PiT family inorganic phosphate transporter